MDDEPVLDLPPFVPARMVNQFVFCPRFFHLAWSSGETGENDLTVDGKWIHRSVDVERGRMGGPSEPSSERVTSLTMSSERLGVITKIDTVAAAEGTVTPIELKRGRPHDPDHPVWEPERIQLALQVLTLRDNGYTCGHGEVRFAEAKERIRIDVDEMLEAKVVRVLGDLRRVATDPLPPPPLVDSPKCNTCIMAGACLPDEQNLVRERTAKPPRRLIPSEDAASPLYLSQPGSRVGIDGERLVVKAERNVIAQIRLIDISQVSIYGNVQVSTQATRELLSREIPICWFSGGGWFFGITEGLPKRNVELRRMQILAGDKVNVGLARRMVAAKILNTRTLLRRNGHNRDQAVLREMKRLAVMAESASEPDRLLGLEGGAARLYFSQFATMIRSESAGDFAWERRNRRPPTDRVNCLLSFLYGVLARECTTTLFGVGFDPYVGIFHRPRFGRPALALDLAEEFRPLLADSCVLTLINNGEVKANDFVHRGGGVALTAEGRKKVLMAYERRVTAEAIHPTFGYKITYRRAIEVQARMLAAVIMGEIETYRGMVMR
jgi:CRISP-associated protein Cas1